MTNANGRLRTTGDYEGALKNFIARQPMGRIGTPEEIALLALYLASDESAFTKAPESRCSHTPSTAAGRSKSKRDLNQRKFM